VIRATVAAIAIAGLGAAAPQSPDWHKQRVTFGHGVWTLGGFVFLSGGPGPFPCLLWNHGSEQNPGTGRQFDEIANAFVPAGFVVFAPMRRGHGLSEGEYIRDTIARERQAHGDASANRVMVHEHETNQLEDQLAGLDYLESLPYVDRSRLAVAGCSFGGIQTLLAAERGAAGFKAAVALSPAAQTWEANPLIRERLLTAVRNISVPVFIIHPAKDASLAPGKTLAAEQARLGKPHQLKIYPAFGPESEQTHCFGGPSGTHVWAPDAVAYVQRVLK
jgi:dienelactone hydrolase